MRKNMKIKQNEAKMLCLSAFNCLLLDCFLLIFAQKKDHLTFRCRIERRWR